MRTLIRPLFWKNCCFLLPRKTPLTPKLERLYSLDLILPLYQSEVRTNMAVLFRRLTEHMQRFDGLFSSALLKSHCCRSLQTSPALEKYYLLPNYLKKWARRDMKRRALYEQHEMERSNLRVLKKNDILPSAVREKAAKDMDKLPLDSSITRVRNRCVLTDRGRGIVGKYRISRIMFRYYADKGLIAGIQKSQW